MTYCLGLDLGTTYSAAAIARGGRASTVPLGNRAAVLPSIVHVTGETVLVGDAARGRAISDPKHTIREFKRRIGDATPILTDARQWRAEDVTALLAAHIVRIVDSIEGGPAEELVLTVPAQWNERKQQLVLDALRAVDGLHLPSVRTISEPEAAAIHYAAGQRIDADQVVAVYDLGGGTFDAALLRRLPSRTDGRPSFSMIGRPGGIDTDSAVSISMPPYTRT